MSSEFAALRAARERAGRSVTEVARSLRIRPEHVRALESGDLSVFGPTDRALAFLAAYARELDLDAAGVVARARSDVRSDVRSDAGEASPRLVAPLAEAAERARREGGAGPSPFGVAGATVGPGARSAPREGLRQLSASIWSEAGSTASSPGDDRPVDAVARQDQQGRQDPAAEPGRAGARGSEPAPTATGTSTGAETEPGAETGTAAARRADEGRGPAGDDDRTIALPPPSPRGPRQTGGPASAPPAEHPVEPIAQPDDLRRDRQSLWRLGAVVLSVLAVGVLAWLVGPGGDDEPTAAGPGAGASADPGAAGASSPAGRSEADGRAGGGDASAAPSAEPTPDTVALTLVVENRSWLRVEVDGENVLEQTLEAGDTREFDAEDEIVVRLGNAGGVEATLNGEDLGALGSSGEVKTVTFTPSGVSDA